MFIQCQKHSDKHKVQAKYLSQSSSSEEDQSSAHKNRSTQSPKAPSELDQPQHDPDPLFYKDVAMADLPSQCAEEVELFRHILDHPDPREPIPRSSTSLLGLGDQKGQQELRPRGPSTMLPLSLKIRQITLKTWSEKLWQVLRSALHSSPEAVLPFHESKKGLADWFVTFFNDKIAKIINSFSSSDSFTLPPPPDVPNFSCFKQVSQEEFRKIIMKSPTKSCLLDPWPTFLVKECIDILLPSIARLANCSLSEGVVPDEFKKAIVTPLIKKSSLPPNDLKNYRPVLGLGFISKLVERVVAS